MKLRTVFVLVILGMLFAMPTFAWDFAGPYSFRPVYQKPAAFSLANQSNYQKNATETLMITILKLSKQFGSTKKAEIASDVPFVFSDNLTSIVGYTPDQIVSTSENSPDLIGVPKEKSLQMENPYDTRIQPDNLIVREEVARLKAEFSGEPSIDNICAIFDYCMHGDNKTKHWLYINSPRGLNWQYANESILIGKATGNVGAGDCADFAIFMSALVESVGGTSRIVCASQNNGDPGHAFAEVYLGQDSSQDAKVESIMNWLMCHYGTHKIYTHVDTDTKDVWLNLDWWAAHPGGSFYKADKYVIYKNRNQIPKIPLES